MRHSCLILACGLMLSLLAGTASAAAATAPTDPFQHLAFRSIGPSIGGGRVTSVVGIPGKPKIYYAGAAGGGVWKTTDGGYQWKAIFSDQPTASISDVVLDPSNPDVVWVATGEVNIRNDVLDGAGLYRSTDAGQTWQLMGFKDAGNISKVVVDPHDGNIVWVAVFGHVWGPNAERGVFKTTDGGKSWKKVLFVDDRSGAIDLTTDADNSQVLFAAMWQAQRYPWKLDDGGPASGLWRSTDGGDTWTKLSDGMPKAPLGRIGVAVAPSNPQHVYALVEAKHGEGLLFDSNDLGEHWQRVSEDYNIDERGFYFSHVFVAPHDEKKLYFTSFFLMESDDGGHSAHSLDTDVTVHVDHHAFWQDPTDPGRMIQGNDGGVYLSRDAGAHWRFADTLPLGQAYQVAADSSQPYNVCVGLQDNDGWCGPSTPPPDQRFVKKVENKDWFELPLGDGQYIVPAPSDPDRIYADSQNGGIIRYDVRTHNRVNIKPYRALASLETKDHAWRFNWTAPIVVSPTDANTVYLGGNVVFKSTDAGQSWAVISPDLTRDDKTKQLYSGGPINYDLSGAEVYDTLLALEIAPTDPKVMWTGSDDGLVHVTRDGGQHWSKVTPPGAPQWARVFKIGVSPFDAGTAYLAYDNHEMDDRKPYVYATDDYGKSWRNISKGLPDESVVVVREDPNRRGFLVLGNMTGLWYSRDDGANWQTFGAGFHTAPVFDLKFVDHALVVATHGLGVRVLDNLRPFEEMDEQVAQQDFHLFTPSSGTQYSRGAGRARQDVLIDYYLKNGITPPPGDKAAKDKPVKIVVSNGDGQVIATGHGPAKAGVNEFGWNMTYAPAVPLASGHEDESGPRSGPQVLPGTYKVAVTANGQTQDTTVTVRGDPNLDIPMDAARANLAFSLTVRNQLSAFHEMLNRLTGMQHTLDAFAKSAAQPPGGQDKYAALADEAAQLDKKLTTFKDSMYNPEIQRAAGDAVHFPGRLNRDLSSLGNANFTRPPDDTERATAATARAELDRKLAQFNAMLAGDVARYNQAAFAAGAPTLMTGNPVQVSEVHM